VIAVVIEYGHAKVLYTSDVQGPTIEDYASWIIREDPDVLIVDGPPTYLFGFTVNRINLDRAIRNLIRILRETTTRVILLDHHAAARARRRILTVAEWYGQTPLATALAEAES
jgi:predicted metallo-beta-lactamase superfamily hydrolase